MICKEKNCNKKANFNLPLKTDPLYCNEHKKKNMIHTKNKRCIEQHCNTRPNYNLPNQYALYCYKHKKENMVDVNNKRCIEEHCNKQPQFNLPNIKKGLYCFSHKKDNMINVVEKRCKEDNCQILSPVFNFPNEKVGIYCALHKKKDMINLKSPRCKNTECIKLASFNLPNKTKPFYCAEHKKQNMVDVSHQRCKEENCMKLMPRFNYEHAKSGIYCAVHKKENMIDVKSKRCLQENCNVIPKYKNKDSKYKGYCLRCFIHLFPNEKISKNYNIKEIQMVNFIKQHFKQEICIFDKRVGGCSKRRPDCYIDKFTHVIIIECDENQHKYYEDICENKRMMELFQDFGNRPIIYIRFNPDTYINEDGKKILSSFKYHKTLDVPIIKLKEWNNRVNILKETINKWLNLIPEKEITNEYLFYNKI